MSGPPGSQHQRGMEEGELEESTNKSVNSVNSGASQQGKTVFRSETAHPGRPGRPSFAQRQRPPEYPRYDAFPRHDRERDMAMGQREHEMAMHGRPYGPDATARFYDRESEIHMSRSFERLPFAQRTNSFSGPIDYAREAPGRYGPFSRPSGGEFGRREDRNWTGDVGPSGWQRRSFDRNLEHQWGNFDSTVRGREPSFSRSADGHKSDQQRHDLAIGKSADADDSTEKQEPPSSSVSVPRAAVDTKDVARSADAKHSPSEVERSFMSPQSNSLESKPLIRVVRPSVPSSVTGTPLSAEKLTENKTQRVSRFSLKTEPPPSIADLARSLASTSTPPTVARSSAISNTAPLELPAVVPAVQSTPASTPSVAPPTIPVAPENDVISELPLVDAAVDPPVRSSVSIAGLGGSRRKTSSWGQGVLSRAAFVESVKVVSEPVVLKAEAEAVVVSEEPVSLAVVAVEEPVLAPTVAEEVSSSSAAGSCDEVAAESDQVQSTEQVNNDVSDADVEPLELATNKRTAQLSLALDAVDEGEEQPRKKRGRPGPVAVAIDKSATVEKAPSSPIVPPAADETAVVAKPVAADKPAGAPPSKPRAGRGAVTGAGRGRGRRPNVGVREAGTSSLPKGLSSKEQRKNRDRALLPKVFSAERDLAKAFTAIRYMVNITQGGAMAMHRIMKSEDVPLQKHLAKIPMPLTSEIAVCLDIIEAKSAFIWRQMTELKREEKVVVDFCAAETTQAAPKRDNERDIVTDVANELVSEIERLNSEPTVITCKSPASLMNASRKFSSAICESVRQQNKARIEESYTTLCAIEPVPWRQVTSKETNYTIARTGAKILKNRAAITQEIRRRMLNKRRAWELLGDRYLALQSKHAASFADYDMDEEDSRRNRSLGSFSRFSSRIGGSSSSFGRSEQNRNDFDNNDRLVQQILLREVMDVRIEKGKADIPDMDCPWQDPNSDKPLLECVGDMKPSELPKFIYKSPYVLDVNGSRLTLDGKRQICSLGTLLEACPRGCNCARQVDLDGRKERVWSDIEKCIFIDKFIQYPKNFPKISSFLANRDTKDCIKFYYDSKAKIQYKSLLRELDNRRRNQRSSWTFSVGAAESAGGSLFLNEDSADREAIVELSADDLSYHSYLQHPPFMQKIFKNFSEDNPMTIKAFCEQKLKPLIPRREPAELEYVQISGVASRSINEHSLLDSSVTSRRSLGTRPRGKSRGKSNSRSRDKDNSLMETIEDDKNDEEAAIEEAVEDAVDETKLDIADEVLSEVEEPQISLKADVASEVDVALEADEVDLGHTVVKVAALSEIPADIVDTSIGSALSETIVNGDTLIDHADADDRDSASSVSHDSNEEENRDYSNNESLAKHEVDEFAVKEEPCESRVQARDAEFETLVQSTAELSDTCAPAEREKRAAAEDLDIMPMKRLKVEDGNCIINEYEDVSADDKEEGESLV